MTVSEKLRTLLLLAASVVAFSGCLLDEPTLKAKAEDNPIEENDPTFEEDPTDEDECVGSLCRLETPADTTMLTPDQKEELVELIETADDSAKVTVSTIDVEALSDSTTRNEVLKDLQTDLFKDMQIPVNPLLLAGVSIDSVLAGVQLTVSGNGSVNVQWSGTIADVQVDKVSLNIQDDEFLGGYAVVDGKYFTFTSLGGNQIAIVYDSKMLWMGECPSLPKASGVQLTCL